MCVTRYEGLLLSHSLINFSHEVSGRTLKLASYIERSGTQNRLSILAATQRNLWRLDLHRRYRAVASG